MRGEERKRGGEVSGRHARSIRGGAASHLHYPPSSEGVPPLDPRARAAVAGREVVEGQRTGEGSSAVSDVVSSLLQEAVRGGTGGTGGGGPSTYDMSVTFAVSKFNGWLKLDASSSMYLEGGRWGGEGA